MATPTMPAVKLISKHLESNGGDLLRQLLREVIQVLMGAQADELCGAAYGERSEDRVNRRNGSRGRELETRVGTLDLAIPKLRHGSYYPEWLLSPRRRNEQALVNVVAECYLTGTSTRRVDHIVQALGIDGISKSRVSEMAKSLDEVVEGFRNRPLTGGYPYVWLDALAIKCREDHRVVNVAVIIATGVRADGQREILGADVITQEDEAGWRGFLNGLVARGLSGVALVISDAHQGLRNAIDSALPGATWQRCRVHFMRNLLTRVPKSQQDLVATLIRTVFSQPTREDVELQHARVVTQLMDRFPEAAALLQDSQPDLLAFASFPKAHWKQIWSNNPQERLNKEIRRRTDVVGIFPKRSAILRLVGAVLSEMNDEWSVARKYFSAESLASVKPAIRALPSAAEAPTRGVRRKVAAMK